MQICGVTMLVVFGSAIALSSVLKYKTATQAPAVIRPQGELRIVQSTIEGLILSITVQENQAVKPGDVIATVKEVSQESKLQTKLSQIAGDIRKGKQLIKNIDDRLSALQLQSIGEQEQSHSTIVGIESELNRANRDYQDKQILTHTEITEANANIETAKADRQAAKLELHVADANLRSIQAAYQAAVAKRDRYQQERQKLLQERLEIVNQIATNDRAS